MSYGKFLFAIELSTFFRMIDTSLIADCIPYVRHVANGGPEGADEAPPPLSCSDQILDIDGITELQLAYT